MADGEVLDRAKFHAMTESTREDQNAFDPDYESMPLSEFEPMLRRVVETPKQSIYRRPGGA